MHLKDQEYDTARNCCLELLNHLKNKGNNMFAYSFNYYMSRNSIPLKLPILEDAGETPEEEIEDRLERETLENTEFTKGDLPKMNYDQLLIHCIFAWYNNEKKDITDFELLEFLMDVNEVLDAEDYCYLAPMRPNKDYPCIFKLIAEGRTLVNCDARGDIYEIREYKVGKTVYFDIHNDKLTFKKYKGKNDLQVSKYTLEDLIVNQDDRLVISIDGEEVLSMYASQFKWELTRFSISKHTYTIRIDNDTTYKIGDNYVIKEIFIYRNIKPENKDKIDS